MKTFFALLATGATTSLASMELLYPPPLRSKYNGFSTNIDWNMSLPLLHSGSDYPCKGYLSDLGSLEGSSVATWPAGSDQEFTVTGGSHHGGGSCQASLSIDEGKTFKVLHSYLDNCPLASSYHFKVPSDTPTGTALFAWTWFNKVGSRDMFMNCASVTISAGSGTDRIPFKSRPDIFLANIGNIGNNCSTIEMKNVAFPNPGLYFSGGSSDISPPICPHKPTAALVRRSTTSPKGCHSTSATTIKASLNGECGGVQTCKGSEFGCCCSKFGYCGSTAAYCGEGCNPSFGRCDGDASVNSISSTTTSIMHSDTTLDHARGTCKDISTATTTPILSPTTVHDTRGCAPATIISTFESVVTITATKAITDAITTITATKTITGAITAITSTKAIADTITTKIQSTTTRPAPIVSRSSGINQCLPIYGCAYRERGFAEYPGTDANTCKLKCDANSQCKAYEYGINQRGVSQCHLLNANASTSYSPPNSDTIVIEPCGGYVIYNSGCPS